MEQTIIDVTAAKDKELASKLKQIKATEKTKHKSDTKALVNVIVSRKDTEKEVSH